MNDYVFAWKQYKAVVPSLDCKKIDRWYDSTTCWNDGWNKMLEKATLK